MSVELISMNEDAIAIMPKKLTMDEAASIPLGGLDRVAGADRESQTEERAKSSHPRGLWGPEAIWKAPVEGGAAVRLTEGKGRVSPQESADGTSDHHGVLTLAADATRQPCASSDVYACPSLAQNESQG